MRQRAGGCNCGRVRYEVEGEPVRVGLCHCQVCRRETGSLGNLFAVWPAERVTIKGGTRNWRLETDERHFCPTCGSSLFAMQKEASEIEVRLGTLDEAPSGLALEYELWVSRREHWLPSVACTAQHEGNRT